MIFSIVFCTFVIFVSVTLKPFNFIPCFYRFYKRLFVDINFESFAKSLNSFNDSCYVMWSSNILKRLNKSDSLNYQQITLAFMAFLTWIFGHSHYLYALSF